MSRTIKLATIFVLCLLLLQACSLGQKTTQEAVEVATEGSVENTQPVTELPTAEPVIVQTEELTAEPTVEPSPTAIVHMVIPVASMLEDKPQVIYDQDSIRKAAQKEAYGGDEFYKGRYERPFDPEMNYYPYIDIIQANLIRNKDSEFIYAIIHLQEDPALLEDGQFGFGIELDVDLDGRGDLLVWTHLPQGTDWSVEGVTVWKDANKSIGGVKPVLSDEPAGGDGYQINLFDSGQGADPALAWSRITPADPTQIHISFKNSILETSTVFLWGAWAMLGADQFELFDHNDHFTYEEAGSPTKSETAYYPLKAMFMLDNTCRAASGYTPKGNEPGLCPVVNPVVEEINEDPTCTRVCIEWASVAHYCIRWDTVCQ